jgi:glucose-1-phosphate cytidylyltransferase
MKVVILAGGLGTRFSEETHLKPKPMIEIGERPILWHIMMIYSYYGFHEFIICLGYKGHLIKQYFANYVMNESDVTFDLRNKKFHYHSPPKVPWQVTLVHTGEDMMTGGRLKKVQKHIGKEAFMLTYGDGVINSNIRDLVKFHQNHGKLATVTAVQPSGRFGALTIGHSNQIDQFNEKPNGDGKWVNGGFFVLQPDIFDYIEGDSTVFEKEPLEQLAHSGQLQAYKHTGFWYAMDTLKDKQHLQQLWDSGLAPWKLW